MRLMDEQLVRAHDEEVILDEDVCNNILRILSIFLGDYLCQ